MAEVWVPNSSPVIVLARVGRLDLMARLAEQVVLPEAVAAEVLAGPTGDPARLAVEAGEWVRRSPQECPPSLLEWGLGAGETSVIALALENHCTAILDDAAARAAARTFGVATVGTIGLLVRAKVRGLITSASQAISEVREAGLYVDDTVVAAALREIGESWP